MTSLDKRYTGKFLRGYRRANRINMNLSGDKLHILELHKAIRWISRKEEIKFQKISKFMEQVHEELTNEEDT